MIPCRQDFRTGVGVFASGGEGLVSDGVSDEVGGGTAVEGVAGMGVTQPVGRDQYIDTDVFCRCAYDLPDAHMRKRLLTSTRRPATQRRSSS